MESADSSILAEPNLSSVGTIELIDSSILSNSIFKDSFNQNNKTEFILDFCLNSNITEKVISTELPEVTLNKFSNETVELFFQNSDLPEVDINELFEEHFDEQWFIENTYIQDKIEIFSDINKTLLYYEYLQNGFMNTADEIQYLFKCRKELENDIAEQIEIIKDEKKDFDIVCSLGYKIDQICISHDLNPLSKEKVAFEKAYILMSKHYRVVFNCFSNFHALNKAILEVLINNMINKNKYQSALIIDILNALRLRAKNYDIMKELHENILITRSKRFNFFRL